MSCEFLAMYQKVLSKTAKKCFILRKLGIRLIKLQDLNMVKAQSLLSFAVMNSGKSSQRRPFGIGPQYSNTKAIFFHCERRGCRRSRDRGH